jgi:translation initiation factor 2 subunit 2
MNYSYDDALTRAIDAVPDRAGGDQSRLSIPDPVGETDGAFTRLTNLDVIADALGRDPEHVHRALQREFGTSGQFDGSRARYNGSFSVADFEAALEAYADEYVVCSECGLPDTNLKTEDGVEMLRCTACGAFRPVQRRSSASNRGTTEAVEERETYELTITGTGRKGDGVAERGKYTIFVPGAQEGQTVEAYIESVSGTLAFARLV